MLSCEHCGHQIADKDLEWVNVNGVVSAYHSGEKFDPETCAYIARHQEKTCDFVATRMLQDEFMK